MIKMLQQRFIGIAMLAMAIVIAFIALVINLGFYISSDIELNKMADYLLENQGEFPERFYLQAPKELGFNVSIESRYETRYFSVFVDDDKVINTNLDNIAEVSLDTSIKYAEIALNSNKKHGYISHYKFAVSTEDGKSLIVFINCYQVLTTLATLKNITILIAIVSLIILFLLIMLLSNKAIQPYIENIERQRQFVADAGHEIKTPLAVISADVEVIEMAQGESDWTKSIRNQIIRLDGLIKQLLSLAKMEEISKNDETNMNVNFSELTKQLSSDFEFLANKKGKTIEATIEDNIFVFGKHDKLEQLISLLLENSTKYAMNDSIIKVNLTSTKKIAILKISNDCMGLKGENLNNLFDRFYRGDKSHNSKIEGYGIGLSVAKAIAESHRGKIAASMSSDNSHITFEIRLPR